VAGGKRRIKKDSESAMLSMTFNSNCNFVKKPHTRTSRGNLDLKTCLPFLSERKTPSISSKILLKSPWVVS